MFPRLIALAPLLFPLYLLRGELFGIPVTLPEVLLGFAFIYFVFSEGVWRRSWWTKYGHYYKVWPLALFVLAGVLGAWVAPDVSAMIDGTEFPAKMRALGILKGWILAPMIYFFMAKFYFVQKPSLIKMSLRALLLGGVFLSLQALYQVVTGEFLTPDGRASGPFESANYLALYLGPIVVYAFMAFIRERNVSWKIFLVLSGILCLAALYATQSYAAWIAVVVAFVVALGVHARKLPRKVKAGIVASLVVVAALAVISQLGTDKFAQFLDFSGQSSSSVRIEIYQIAAAMIQDHPILGIGLGQFEQLYQVMAVDVLGQEPFEWNMLHPHNIFLGMWLSMGLLGLVAFVWLCLAGLPWLMEQDKKERRIAALMLVAMLAHGLFDTPYFKNDLAFEFWLLMAILL